MGQIPPSGQIPTWDKFFSVPHVSVGELVPCVSIDRVEEVLRKKWVLKAATSLCVVFLRTLFVHGGGILSRFGFGEGASRWIKLKRVSAFIAVLRLL